MFEKTTYQCPNCGAVVRQDLKDGEEFTCLSCNNRYKVLLDEDTGKAGFVETTAKEMSEPLFLPKGSIRALVTIAMAFSCWILIFTGRDVPGYLFGLLLTIIGYYFGFRKKIKTAESRIFDATAKEEEPLFLPHGFMRVLLILGFVISSIVLLATGRLKELDYLEFFVVLFGLITGYVFARVLSAYEETSFYVSLNHVKGVVVLAAAAYLAHLVLSGSHARHTVMAMVLSAIISFYFGSRS